ncbi:MAG: glycoside hydrolase family 5 protein [Desertifilum sp.]|nr:cellulase family glycosylhydrolase [Oscillatoria laete-virens]MCD8490073.1 glycoside hydrolase family 5 protein [Desertifilum sp.]MDL5054293.1 cellulase family glycosylhydrolase [Oscillatoria laete-virens NRMC-F 0139]
MKQIFTSLLSLTLSCCAVASVIHLPSAVANDTPPPQLTSTDINHLLDLDSRLMQLTNGINLSHWFAQSSNYSDTRLNSFITQTDLATIKSLGFNHVRLPVDPILLLNEGNPSDLNAHYLQHLDRALNLILNNDLAVIVDLHPNSSFKERLAKDDGFVAQISQFWGSFAQHLSHFDPERLFLEVLNEPSFNWYLSENPVERWDWVQNQLIDSIRVHAPQHTILATGHDWNNIEGLLQLTPIADPNVIYSLHFYEPIVFTHQGTNWVHEHLSYIRNLPYGVDDDDCEQVLSQISLQKAVDLAYGYCQEEWDRDKIKARIATLAAWKQAHQVRVVATEFGASRFWVNPEDRFAWTQDVRSVLEEYNMGWTLWDYTGNFALAPKTDGIRIVDPQLVSALNLEPEQEVFQPPQSVPEPSAIAGLALMVILAKRKLTRI